MSNQNPDENTFIETSGDQMAIGVRFDKIDVAKRTVEGFATLDNIDKTGEIVDFGASQLAFRDWMGNIREMHGHTAVGKALSVEEREKDSANGNKHRGMYVKAYISRGANDTWEKILDGTLGGFSIGGKVIEKRPEVIKTDNDTYSSMQVSRITKYRLGELSVVDNPANPLALFDKVNKSLSSTSLVKYDSDETLHVTDVIGIDERDIFYCKSCDVADVYQTTNIVNKCGTCENEMTLVATTYEPPTAESIKKMVSEYLDLLKLQVEPSNTEKVEVNSEPESTPVETFNNVTQKATANGGLSMQNNESELLQNANDDKKVIKLFENLVEAIADKVSTESFAKINGGDFEKVDNQALNSIRDVLKSAFANVEEILGKAGVVNLNSENATDVSVAASVSLPAPIADNSEPGQPDANGNGAKADTWAAPPADSNVLPHMGKAEEAAPVVEETKEEVVVKTEVVEEKVNEGELMKTIVTDELAKFSAKTVEALDSITNSINTVADRVSNLENSGAAKKSGEVNEELAKSQPKSFWGGAFSVNNS